jgi:hypothetical protein
MHTGHPSIARFLINASGRSWDFIKCTWNPLTNPRELFTDLTVKKCTISYTSRDVPTVIPLNLTKTTTSGRNKHYLKQCTTAKATPRSTVAQMIKQCSATLKTQQFITVLRRTQLLSRARYILYIASNLNTHFNIIRLSTHTYPTWFFHSCFFSTDLVWHTN